MPVPTAPTATTICTEALKMKLNGATPATADVTRAVEYGLEKVKRDIMLVNSTWSPLIKTYYGVTVEGVSKYSNPSDMESMLRLDLLEYSHSGTLTAVNNTNKLYTLSATEDISKAEAEGRLLLISSGTGANQAVQIDDYNESTKVVTGAEAFSTAPIVGDGYIIADESTELEYDPMIRVGKYRSKGKPSMYFPLPDSYYGSVELYPVPDAVYGIRWMYFADLRMLDTDTALYSKILRRWANVLTQGVYVWTLGEDDDRYDREFQIYNSMLKQLKARDAYMYNESSSLVRMVLE